MTANCMWSLIRPTINNFNLNYYCATNYLDKLIAAM